MELFGTNRAAIKPIAFADNKKQENRIGTKIYGPGYLPTGGKKTSVPYLGSAKMKAQYLANQYGGPAAYREEDYFGPTRTSLYPGQTGTVLPEQWRYKPAKNPDELFDKGFDEIFTPNDIAQIEKYAKRYELDPDELKYELYHDAIYRTRNNGSLALTNAKNDSMEEILGRIVDKGK